MEEKKIVETLFVRRSVNVSEQDIDDMSIKPMTWPRKLQKQGRGKRIELKHWQRDIQREWPST